MQLFTVTRGGNAHENVWGLRLIKQLALRLREQDKTSIEGHPGFCRKLWFDRPEDARRRHWPCLVLIFAEDFCENQMGQRSRQLDMPSTHQKDLKRGFRFRLYNN